MVDIYSSRSQVEAEELPEISKKYDVSAVPFFLFFKVYSHLLHAILEPMKLGFLEKFVDNYNDMSQRSRMLST